MPPHGHGHSCGSECHHDDDDHLQPGQGQQDLLFSAIDRESVTALNESVAGSAKEVIKPYHERMDEDRFLESDADDQLIIRIPFSGTAKLRSLLLKAGPAELTPTSLHLYANVETLDFDDVSSQPPSNSSRSGGGGGGGATQKLESVAQTRDVVEYPLRVAKFSSVRQLHVFVPSSVGGERTRIYYLGLRGEHAQTTREAPANLVYEAAPQAKDHVKLPGLDNTGSHSLGPG